MAAVGLHGEAHGRHALLGDADEAAGALETGEHVLHYGAALVEHELGLDALLGEPINDVHRAGAADLLAAREREIDVVLGHEALRDEGVRAEEHAVEGDLGVERTAPPEHAVDDLGREGVVVPELLVHGHHVVVRHEHGGLAGLAAGPLEEQRAVIHARERAGLEHMRVELGQQPHELLELGVVLERMVVVRDGLAADEGLQRRDRGIAIELDRLRAARLLRGWRELRRADSKGRGSACAERSQRSGYGMLDELVHARAPPSWQRDRPPLPRCGSSRPR